MPLMRIFGRIEPGASGDQSPADVRPVRLKCPKCLAEFSRPLSMAFDARIKCIACDATSEFREFHEARCLTIRPELALNFPDLLWLMSEEILAPLSSADALEGDRRAAVPLDTALPAPAIRRDVEEGDGFETDRGRPARKARKMDRL